MFPMDTTFTAVVLEQLEQLITTIVIAAALVAYARSNTRIFESLTKMLEMHIEPTVEVELVGDSSENTLVVTNHAACEIGDLTVTLSVGCIRGYQAHPARQAIFARKWDSLAPGETAQTDSPAIDLSSLSDEGLPEGVTLDRSDLVVNFAYIRRADKRKYSYKYRIGFVKRADGKQSFIRIDEPKHIFTAEVGTDRSSGLAPRLNRLAPSSPNVLAAPATADRASASSEVESPCIG